MFAFIVMLGSKGTFLHFPISVPKRPFELNIIIVLKAQRMQWKDRKIMRKARIKEE